MISLQQCFNYEVVNTFEEVNVSKVFALHIDNGVQVPLVEAFTKTHVIKVYVDCFALSSVWRARLVKSCFNFSNLFATSVSSMALTDMNDAR